MILYYRRDGTPYPPGRVGLMQWAKDFEDMEYKRVALDKLPNGIEVSTVWLGINHRYVDFGRPLIFETMLFVANHATYTAETGIQLAQSIGEQWRYSTEEEARRGHKMLVKKWSKFRTAEQVLAGR